MPQHSRYENRSKMKKTSGIMYILAGVFATLLLAFLINLFAGSGKESEFVYGPTTPEAYKDDVVEQKEIPDDNDKERDQEDGSEEESNDAVKVTKAPSDKENVNEVITGDWEPVSTTQEGEHVTSYEKGSADWNEMMRAVEKATGLSQDNMIIWWLGNGGSPNTSTATVSTKDNNEIYRVQLQWVENQGWKPVQAETLESNPHG